jgi:hypothetical protein
VIAGVAGILTTAIPPSHRKRRRLSSEPTARDARNHSQDEERTMPTLDKHWLHFAIATAAALAVWALAAAHGYAWQTIWLPAAVARAAWPPRQLGLAPRQCLRRLRGDRQDPTPPRDASRP